MSEYRGWVKYRMSVLVLIITHITEAGCNIELFMNI